MLPALTTSHRRTGDSILVAGYQSRWRWWYAAIVDIMISEPNLTIKEIAAKLDKHPNTISAITGTDNFKTYFAHRKQEWMERHDFAIMSKTQAVGLQALDLVLETMQQKRTAVPLALLSNIADKSFERLGYGPKSPAAVQINNTVGQQNIVQLPAISAEALMEAREALRRVERGHAPRLIEHEVASGASGAPLLSSGIERSEVEEETDLRSAVEKEMELAPINLSA